MDLRRADGLRGQRGHRGLHVRHARRGLPPPPPRVCSRLTLAGWGGEKVRWPAWRGRASAGRERGRGGPLSSSSLASPSHVLETTRRVRSVRVPAAARCVRCDCLAMMLRPSSQATSLLALRPLDAPPATGLWFWVKVSGLGVEG